MAYELLVIDDEWTDRGHQYHEFAAAVNALSATFQVSVELLRSPVDLPQKISSRRFAAVIIDAKLDGKWPGFSLQRAVATIGRELPIALVSSRWDNTTADEVTAALEQPNCSTFLRWSELIGSEDGGVGRVAFSLSKMIMRHRDLDFSLDVEPDEPLRLLHVSDLQFGPKIRTDVGALAIQCAEAVLDGWQRRGPHFIAITGDVVEKGLPSEYLLAEQWLREFVRRLNFGALPSPRLMLVPGNHDYCLPFAAAARVGFGGARGRKDIVLSKDVAADAQSLLNYAFRPFVDFASRVADVAWLAEPDWQQHCRLTWLESRFRDLGVLFYGLNSNNPVTANGFSGRKVHLEELNSLQARLLEFIQQSAVRPIVVGLGHHSPVGNSGRRDDAENLSDLSNFLGGPARTSLFLHGHIHRAEVAQMKKGAMRLMVSTASTLTLPDAERAADTLRGFTLVDLKRTAGKVVGIRVQPFNFLNNQFTPSQEEVASDVS